MTHRFLTSVLTAEFFQHSENKLEFAVGKDPGRISKIEQYSQVQRGQAPC